jgi:hypothetical protein
MHSAGCLSDGVIPNQNIIKFETTLNPKIRGGWNLHTLTLENPLEHFVMFSSMSGIVGLPGQSNHAGCNTFLDKLAWYRRSIGLAATTINWGQWGEVGVAVGKEIIFGFPMTTKECLNALSLSLRKNVAQVVAVQIDIGSLGKTIPWLQTTFETLAWDKSSEGKLKKKPFKADMLIYFI